MTEGPVSKCFNRTQDKQTGDKIFHDPILQDPYTHSRAETGIPANTYRKTLNIIRTFLP